MKKVGARLSEQDDVIKLLLRGPRAKILYWAPHLLGSTLSKLHMYMQSPMSIFLSRTSHDARY